MDQNFPDDVFITLDFNQTLFKTKNDFGIKCFKLKLVIVQSFVFNIIFPILQYVPSKKVVGLMVACKHQVFIP